MRSAPRWVAAVAASALLLAGCSGNPETEGTREASAPEEPSTPQGPSTQSSPREVEPASGVALREGERIIDVAMPTAYTPSSPGPGTDDYRCFLLDLGLQDDAFVTGVDVAPGDRDVVHHVILFRVPPDQVASAEEVDRRAPGQGWTCFGGSGLETMGGGLDDAPWLGAWAPGGGESVLADDIGIPVEGGSRIVMQVHYNLLAGTKPDLSSARLRIADGSRDLAALQTSLLPAPVELPCRRGAKGRLCNRGVALRDLTQRFGMRAGQLVMGLQFFCGRGERVRPSATQSCTLPVDDPATVRGVAGHMHLLGRRIRIELNPDGPRSRTLLDIPVWDFDDQRVRSLERPVRMRAGDELRVTCTHDQGLRDLLPAFEGQPERYVLWGEGTTDEMCLGIVLVTRP